MSYSSNIQQFGAIVVHCKNSVNTFRVAVLLLVLYSAHNRFLTKDDYEINFESLINYFLFN